jgi:hypothetical protein
VATQGSERERDILNPAALQNGEAIGLRVDRLSREELAFLLDGMRLEEEGHLRRLRAMQSGLEGNRLG